jgi:hypothetical protein
MKNFLKKFLNKNSIKTPLLFIAYQNYLNFNQIYHNKPFGFFKSTRNKTIDPSKLKTLIQDYNDINQKEGINFDEVDFLENAKEVFENTRPLLFKRDTEVLKNLELLTKDCFDGLNYIYEKLPKKLKKYELSLLDTKIDSFSSFKTNDDLFTYVRVEVI